MIDVYKRPLKFRLIAEFIAAFILTICVGYSLSDVPTGVVGLITGAVLLLTVLAVVPISGGHMNPSVTIGLFINRIIDVRQTLSYVAAQFIGVLCGMGVLFALQVPWRTHLGLPMNILFFEMLGAFVFGLAYGLALYGYIPEPIIGPVIGIGLLLGIYIGSFAGTSFINPALGVVFAPYSYMMLIAPIIGFSLGILLISLLSVNKRKL